MKKISLTLILILYSFPLLAQDLSTNPWVEKNTQEQINSIYEKRNKKLGTNNTLPPKLNQDTPQKPSILDKVKSLFSDKDSASSTKEISIPDTRRQTRPQKITSHRPSHLPKNYGLTPAAPTDAVETSSPISLPNLDFDMPRLPSGNSNSILNKTKRNFKKSLNQIKKLRN